MIKIATLAACMALMAACASVGQFSKPGVSESQYQADGNACLYQAKVATAGGHVAGAYGGGSLASGIVGAVSERNQQVDLLILCMQQKGYTHHPG